ncbi:MAG TPA: AraC family transcriptional regulator ligand-binding domain-containing protein [Rhodocyclaceae bacterium]
MKFPPDGQRHLAASVAPAFVTGMIAALQARGADLAPAFKAAGLGTPWPNARSRVERVPVSYYAALYNALAEAFDDEAFGMFAQPLRCGSFECLCRVVADGNNLGVALARAAQYLRIILPEMTVSLTSRRESAELRLTACGAFAQRAATDATRIFAFEWLLRLLHALACWLLARAIPLDSVEFPFPRPEHADDYALIYTEHSRFRQESNTLVARFPLDLLRMPLRRDARALERFLDGAPGKIALLYRRDRELANHIRELVARSLPLVPSVNTIADSLALSPRTLHRRLSEEGSNCRAIIDAVRRDRALARLATSNQPLSTIAAELGFIEASAFYRAVVSWTGASPSAYRNRLK